MRFTIKNIILLIALLWQSLVFAQTASEQEIQKIVENFTFHNTGEVLLLESIKQMDLSTDITIYYNQKMFVIINENKQYSPIMAFSFENGIHDIQNEKQLLLALFGSINGENKEKGINYQNPEWAYWLTKIEKNTLEEQTYGPLLISEFGQVNCHDENSNVVNVSNLYTPNNVAVGCVAISLATVLDYYEWPLHGLGEKTYLDSNGQITGEFSADFENATYDYEAILDRYDNQSSTTTQRQALGTLAYHSAVSINMDFESGGSTSNVNKIPTAFSKYLRFFGEYKTNNYNNFFYDIDTSIMKSSIIPLAIYDDSGHGHSVVCDGLKILDNGKKYYHLNMGWWGSSNGWYQIHSDFNAGGYTKIDGGVFNIVPTPEILVDNENERLVINWDIPEKVAVDSFLLQMRMDNQDWVNLETLVDTKRFELENDNSSKYDFRIRAYYSEFPDVVAWSNDASYDNTTTSISDVSFLDLRLYPNPASNYLYIDSEKKWNDAQIIIADISGRIFYNKKHYERQIKINLQKLPAGLYLIKIISDEDVATKRFVKK